MKKITLSIIILFSVLGVQAQKTLNIHHFPIPVKTKERLFYIQRNLNKNTIVYDANYDKNGMLDKENPVRVYWIRYEKNAVEMELRTIERKLAFGVKSEALSGQRFDYKVSIAALKNRWFYIKQIAPFKSIVCIKQNGKYIPLDHIYVNSDPERYLSAIESIEVYGGDINPSSSLVETIEM